MIETALRVDESGRECSIQERSITKLTAVVITSAVDSYERLVSKVTCLVLIGR